MRLRSVQTLASLSMISSSFTLTNPSLSSSSPETTPLPLPTSKGPSTEAGPSCHTLDGYKRNFWTFLRSLRLQFLANGMLYVSYQVLVCLEQDSWRRVPSGVGEYEGRGDSHQQ